MNDIATEAAWQAVFSHMINSYNVHSCINCKFFTAEELCEKANARPPAKIIVFGCEAWSPDIPF